MIRKEVVALGNRQLNVMRISKIQGGKVGTN